MAHSHGGINSNGENNRLNRLSTLAAVIVASSLAALKLFAWVMTGSVAILASLVDSVMDLFSSSITFAAVRHAQRPADSDHRFGHGKAEPLAALAQAGFTLASGIYLMIEVVQRLLAPQSILHSDIGIGVMVVSILATLGLVALQIFVAKKTGSVAIKADSLHYKGDLLANIAVIIAIVLSSQFNLPWLDPIFGLFIAIYIIKAAKDVFMESYDMLMDKEFPDADRAKIQQLALDFGDVLGVHDLRTRQSGPNSFIQMHLDMNGALTLNRAHATADAVEKAIMDAFPGSEVMVHQDPVTPKTAPEAPTDDHIQAVKKPRKRAPTPSTQDSTYKET
ncbi:MAG: cation diffusion facilitator family transporter [Alphaproteobacteria bacterium]|nr:cation diffusion facilitator family transporter [Alphaproteobacteria bacterium]